MRDATRALTRDCLGITKSVRVVNERLDSYHLYILRTAHEQGDDFDEVMTAEHNTRMDTLYGALEAGQEWNLLLDEMLMTRAVLLHSSYTPAMDRVAWSNYLVVYEALTSKEGLRDFCRMEADRLWEETVKGTDREQSEKRYDLWTSIVCPEFGVEIADRQFA